MSSTRPTTDRTPTPFPRWRPSTPTALTLALWTLAATASAEVVMTEVSTAAGVDGFTYGSTTDHSLGINWVDVDRDGDPDLFLVGGNPNKGLKLYLNDGDGTFTERPDLLPTLPAYEKSGSVFADYDNDGDFDLYVYTDHGTWDNDPGVNPKDGPPNFLLQNQLIELGGVPGDQPLFLEVAAAAGVDDLADTPLGPDYPGYRAKTASWLDYDRDGCVDLFVGHWVMNSGGDAANRDRLYRNNCEAEGAVTFSDVTASSGIDDGLDPTRFRAALASMGAHLDDDLYPDLYVVNAGGGVEVQPYINDLIYRNNGDGTFTEITGTMTGIGNDSQAGMGVDTADIDLDGDWDLYVSDLRSTTNDEEPKGNVLYLSRGDGTYDDNSAVEAGVQGHNSWGVNFFDVDHDGLEDLYVSTMNGAADPFEEMLFLNQGGNPATFINAGVTLGMTTGNARGSAVADYDGDGDLDLAVVNQGGELQLFRNDSTDLGHWFQLQLSGAPRNLDAIGTLVVLTTGGVERRRQVKGGSSAHSQDALTLHFGLGDATTIDRIEIFWPDGRVEELLDVAVDQKMRWGAGQIFADGFESGDVSLWTSSVGGAR